MNVWGAPERVRPAHLAHERAQFSRDLRPANMVARSPAPIRSKSSAVPANNRLRPDNRHRAKDEGEPMIKPNKQKTIGIVEVRSFRRPPAKHIDLLPQDQDFCFQLCSRLEERSQYAENQLEQILHQVANLPRLFSASMLNRIFGTHRGVKNVRGKRKNKRCLRRIKETLKRHEPDALVLQDTSPTGTVRARRIMKLNTATSELAEDLDVPICSISHIQVREAFAYLGITTKQTIAETIAKHVPAFSRYLPPVRKPWMSEDTRFATAR